MVPSFSNFERRLKHHLHGYRTLHLRWVTNRIFAPFIKQLRSHSLQRNCKSLNAARIPGFLAAFGFSFKYFFALLTRKHDELNLEVVISTKPEWCIS